MDKLELLLNKAIFVQKQINAFKEMKRYKNHGGMMGDDMMNGIMVVEAMPMDDEDGMGMEIPPDDDYFTEEEEDWEGDMARTELAAIVDKAKIVREMLSPQSELPAWIQSKITLAARDINAVHDYIKYKNYEC